MILNAYEIHEDQSSQFIRKAELKREWMDDTQEQYAYRCLPLNMANQFGWEICIKEKVKAIWNGGSSAEDIKIITDNKHNSTSIFGHGILTFHIQWLFKTENPYNLYITGPANNIISGIQPLSGIYETNWAPFSFTMNWKFLEPNKIVTFEKDTPICLVFPINPELLENTTLKIDSLKNNKEIYNQYFEWSKSRDNFHKMDRSNLKSSETWQKHYFQGKYVDGTKCPFDHRTKYKINIE